MSNFPHHLSTDTFSSRPVSQPTKSLQVLFFSYSNHCIRMRLVWELETRETDDLYTIRITTANQQPIKIKPQCTVKYI